MAQVLGYCEVVFLYQKAKDFWKGKSEVKVTCMTYGSNQGASAIKLTEKNARLTFEKWKPQLAWGAESLPIRDKMHERASGLNHITTRFASEAGTAIAFSLADVLGAKKQAEVLGRMSQNIMLCRKAKTKMIIGSFASTPQAMRAPRDIIGLFVTLGMHRKEAQDALQCEEVTSSKK